MKSMHAFVAAAVFVAGVAAGASAAQPFADPLALTGNDWQAMGPDVREAYLQGFVAGAATHQATAGKLVEGKRAAAAAARLKRQDALAFPYGTNVYRSHLDDYYFYENRRVQPLIEVLVDLNSHYRNR